MSNIVDVKVSGGGSTDQAFYITPTLGNIEKLRLYLMKPGGPHSYDPAQGVVIGGHYPNGPTCGIAPGNWSGAVMVDNNLLLGPPLDYLNAGKEVLTSVEATTRNLLSKQWNGIGNCSKVPPQTYDPFRDANHGLDRREILMGSHSPYFSKLAQWKVWTGGTQQWILLGKQTPFSKTGGGPITELPNAPQAHPLNFSGKAASLEGFAPAIMLLYLQGQKTQAVNYYLNVAQAWTGNGFGPYSGMGGKFDPRNAGYFIMLSRAFDMIYSTYWKQTLKAVAGSMTLEQVVSSVQTMIMAHQLTTGADTGSFGAPESNGEIALAYHPLYATFFGH